MSVCLYKKAFCLSKISIPKTQSYYSLNPFAYVPTDMFLKQIEKTFNRYPEVLQKYNFMDLDSVSKIAAT